MILMCPCTYNRFHLFFLIQSILLFHDRRFFQLVLYMYDYNDKNTVGKHLFFLIQSILLFHDRCCFTFFFQFVLYMYDYNDKNTVGKHLFFLFKVYYFLSIPEQFACRPYIYIYNVKILHA